MLINKLVPIIGAFASLGASADVSDLNAEIDRVTNETLLWGPYRPNVYFGVRPRIPKSFIGGLMWANVDSYADISQSTYSTMEQLRSIASSF
jgi:mannosyl-oligosaccharide glucosidase